MPGRRKTISTPPAIASACLHLIRADLAKVSDHINQKGASMREEATELGWLALLAPRLVLPLSALLGGVLLHSMNVLITATLLPSVVKDVGGAALMSWPTTAFVASSIVAATAAGVLTAACGAGRAFCGGAVVYCLGAVLCGLAASMPEVIAGRFVQGLGGGLLSALAYVLVRSVFPEALWPRVFGLLAGIWSVSILIGPLTGGLFAGYGYWRGAFFVVAAVAFLLSIVAIFILPAGAGRGNAIEAPLPILRMVLACAAIALLSAASVTAGVVGKAALIVSAIGAFVLMLRFDRLAIAALLPSDAFSMHSTTGSGLWMVLLLSAAYSPLAIYAPLFLQRLHALQPLTAGYMVAGASLAWTTAALTVASLSPQWPARLIIAGPTVMAIGLLGVGVLMAPGPVAALPLPIAAIGIGIGACWAFVAQRVMSGAKPGEENIAASSVATVQQAGIAFGAAVSGLVANASGLTDPMPAAAVLRAAFWVPAAFAVAPLAAVAIGTRLNRLARRSARGHGAPAAIAKPVG
jgi:MFS family permease